MARVYVFNPTLDGVGYILKGLDDLEGKCNTIGVHSLAASMYELGKFLPGRLMLSQSFQGIILERMNIGDRQRVNPKPVMFGASPIAGGVQAASDSKKKKEGLRYEADIEAQAETRFPLSSTVRSGERIKETVNVASWINILKS